MPVVILQEVPRKTVAGPQQETQREIKFAVHGGASIAFAESSYHHVVSRLFKCLSLFATSRNAAFHYIYTQKQPSVNPSRDQNNTHGRILSMVWAYIMGITVKVNGGEVNLP